MAEIGKQNFMPGIKEKVVVITGASSGTGEATVVMLAERERKGRTTPPFSCAQFSRFTG